MNNLALILALLCKIVVRAGFSESVAGKGVYLSFRASHPELSAASYSVNKTNN
jgi:hypothetical protein